MANEIILVDEWLATVMLADATLTGLVGNRIYSYVAPEGAAHPLIVYNHQGSSDYIVIGGYRIMNSGLYQIKAIGQADSMTAVQATANQIDVLFGRTEGAVTGGIILACHREQPLGYVETKNNIRYPHLGGLYRIYIQGT